MTEDKALVELAGVTVRTDRLTPEAAGIEDETLRAAIESVRSSGEWEELPSSGWRVLTDQGDSVVVGAYDESVWHGWCTITMRRQAGCWTARSSTFGQQPRPTAAARGRGLALTFSRPIFTSRHGQVPKITVRLSNHSDRRVQETTSPWAFGHLIDLGTGVPLPAEEQVAVAAIGWDLDLHPGADVDLPVLLFTREPDRLAPGEYGVDASFGEFALRATGGRLRIV